MIWPQILSFLFPPRCVSCARDTSDGIVICDECKNKIEFHRTLICGQCGARLAEGKRICHPKYPYIFGAATDYRDETVKALIAALKFKGVKDAAKPLSELLIRYGEHLPLRMSHFTVVPIPLSARRLRERGFNQSALIAERFAAHFTLPYAPQLLTRTRHTKPQSELAHYDVREKNVENCFAVPQNEAKNISAKNILLIDDVRTSGATLAVAAQALKNAGARRVVALTVAKA